MIVTGVDLYSDYSDEPIELSFRDVRSINPYRVTGIQGLDADDIVPRYYASGAQGEKYFNFALRKKDVVVKISLNPRHSEGETYSSLRDHLYRSISASRTGAIRLVFKNDSVEWAQLEGFIVGIEASHFSKTPDLELKITCFDPMLRSIASLTIPDTELGNSWNPTIVDDVSTAPHGFVMTASFNQPMASYNMRDKTTNPSWSFTITPQGGFLAGDLLVMSTEANKELFILRGSTWIQIADRVNPGSIWPIIFPGTNQIFGNSNVPWNSVSYRHAFWGV